MNKFLIIGIIVAAIIIGWLFFRSKGKKGKMNGQIINGQGTGSTNDQVINPNINGQSGNMQGALNEQEMQEMQDMLGYDINDEPKIMANLKNMEMSEIKIYADKVTKEHANDQKFLEAQLPEDLLKKLGEIDFSNPQAKDALLNPTTIGNAAFIASTSTSPYKERAVSAFNFLMGKLQLV